MHKSFNTLWDEALAESAAGQSEPDEFRLGLLHLSSWPEVPALPLNLVPSVVRVCALLSHKPTVGFLVAKVLDLDETEAQAILRVLRLAGHLEVLHRKAAVEPELASGGSGAAALPASPQGAFLSRLWKALVS